jgi:tryptophanyl-tRNA synthetase
MSGKPQAEVNDQWQGKTNYADLKQAVAEAVKQFLTDFQDKLSKVDNQAVLDHLSSSEEAMNKAASETLTKVQLAVGLRK